jgi:hypothetical protein
MKRTVLAAAIGASAAAAMAQGPKLPPPMNCAVNKHIFLLYAEKTPRSYSGPFASYRIDSKGRLHIRYHGAQERQYGHINAFPDGRYEVDQKILYFREDFRSVAVTSVDQLAVLIDYADCVKSP